MHLGGSGPFAHSLRFPVGSSAGVARRAAIHCESPARSTSIHDVTILSHIAFPHTSRPWPSSRPSTRHAAVHKTSGIHPILDSAPKRSPPTAYFAVDITDAACIQRNRTTCFWAKGIFTVTPPIRAAVSRGTLCHRQSILRMAVSAQHIRQADSHGRPFAVPSRTTMTARRTLAIPLPSSSSPRNPSSPSPTACSTSCIVVKALRILIYITIFCSFPYASPRSP
ncbi:hypothetical protein K438DRAFT_1866285 [Mycena galopus ATCC 62051]|nr:hypothetical protein K438DRAFT_1866285 [Mycena galopus ATCC 62051]